MSEQSFCKFKSTKFLVTVQFWVIFTFILSCWAVRAQTAPQQKLRGHIPAAVSRLTPIGQENTADHLKLAIGLPLRNEEELRDLLQQIYDPASPNYRHYLTPEEFTARFGPTEEDYQAVMRYARQNGFSVTATHPNRVVLDVDASVADIQRSLHVTMQTYQHPREARKFHAPDTEPTVDLAVPILHISGLDNYSLPHPKMKPKPMTMTENAVPQSGSAPGGSYMGNDFRTAYSVGSLTGAGQTVGLLQFDGYYPADIVNYQNLAGLPNVTLTNVAIDGGVSTPGDGVGEVSLDIEMVMSMAPGVSKIIVYEAPNPSPWVDLLSRMANDNLAKQLSCSWGGGGADPTSEQIFLQMAAQGQSFFNASGDSDAFTSSVEFPSDSTNITQVGGTTLATSGGAYVSETVWNWGNQNGSYVGSSGGVSTTYKIPSYQSGIDMTANLGSTTMRNVPDVALTGDNVYVIYGNGQTGAFGGTSCAAPLWAGFMALVNQQAATGGHGPVGFINPAIYAIGKSNPNYATIFHDVTAGNNFSVSSPTKYPATVGYDLCTGWGTPNGTNLINVLAPPSNVPLINAAGYALVAESCLPTNGAIDSGESVTVNFSLLNVGGVGTSSLQATLLETNGVGQPSAPQNYGALAGGGSAVTRSFTFTVTGSCGTPITPTFKLQDGATSLGMVAFSLPVGEMAAIFSESFDGVSAPALPSGWTSSGGGSLGAWVTSTSKASSLPNGASTPVGSAVGSNMLVSPVITLASGPAAVLSFRNNYNLEMRPTGSTAYDGGVLEIKVGSGAFTDIISAGGSFVSGGYNKTISASFGNPLGGRQGWSGNSGGFTNTVVNLPASASGQAIQLRWRFGCDQSTASTGWYIDTVSISNLVCCSGSGVVNHPAVLSTISDIIMAEKTTLTFTNNASDPDQPSQTLIYSLSNAPAGASIGASSGIFSWTPTEAQGPSTNSITVIVTDNGTPPMSAAQTFNVIVQESNQPPVLASIANRTIHAGMALAITNSATDPDLPANGLSFSLNAAPAGASINSTNGVFLWTPDSAFMNTTSTVTVLVTDNNPWAVNAQHLTDSKSFTVAVMPAPTFTAGAATNGSVTVTWSSIPGQKYRVQYSTNLTGGNWIDLAPDITATGSTASQTDSAVSGDQRFYRVLVLP